MIEKSQMYKVLAAGVLVGTVFGINQMPYDFTSKKKMTIEQKTETEQSELERLFDEHGGERVNGFDRKLILGVLENQMSTEGYRSIEEDPEAIKKISSANELANVIPERFRKNDNNANKAERYRRIIESDYNIYSVYSSRDANGKDLLMLIILNTETFDASVSYYPGS